MKKKEPSGHLGNVKSPASLNQKTKLTTVGSAREVLLSQQRFLITRRDGKQAGGDMRKEKVSLIAANVKPKAKKVNLGENMRTNQAFDFSSAKKKLE